MGEPAALVVTGATATGKTALAIEVARRIGGSVISMDSRQVYRGMDIGTAKPSVAERRGVPHYGFDVVGPDERYSAGRFARDARRWIADIRAAGRVPILAGGTGFFLRALTDPLFEEPPMRTDRREALKAWLSALPNAELARWAERLDPTQAARGGGRQRQARAIEVALLTGRPLSGWQRAAPARQPRLDARVFVLDLSRDKLVRRVDARVHDMVAAGLVAEVDTLLRSGHGPDDPGMNATGYIELIPHLAGKTTLEAAVERIQAATRRYARRQRTWLRHQLPADAVRLDAARPTGELAGAVVESWQANREAET